MDTNGHESGALRSVLCNELAVRKTSELTRHLRLHSCEFVSIRG
jgi:hypothetical protein